MKLVIGIGVLVALALIGFIVTSNQANAPTPEEEGVPASMEELNTAQDETADMEVAMEANTPTAEVDLSTANDVPADAMVFTMDSFNYGYSMEEIRVPAGTTVTINLTNSDGFHDWVLDEFDAATTQISAGDTTSVTFVADTPGSYEYYCSVGNHRAQGMVGTLIVE